MNSMVIVKQYMLVVAKMSDIGKTKSPTFAELFADRGHPGPVIFDRALDSTLLPNREVV